MERKSILRLVILLLMTAIILAGCAKDSDQVEGKSALDLLQSSWPQVQAQAKDQTVNLYMWGGSDSINRYMDEWVAPRLKQEEGVTLHRVPITDIKDVINKLLAEKQVGKTDGSTDILWLNGENFALADQSELLWGPVADKLPNVQKYIAANAPEIAYDFGRATKGMEVPWGKAQYVFAYDSAKVTNPPTSMAALAVWAQQNPGKFTYPAPPDFTGSAFVRQTLYETTGGYQQYLAPFDSASTAAKVEPLWQYLKALKPHLWRQGQTYPASLAQLDQLYTNGEVWMTMCYDAAAPASQVQKGYFPASTKTFVLDGGTLSNTHYLAIPNNSTHKAGALATINFLLSPEAQIAKFDPANWGDGVALDLLTLTDQDRNRLASIDRGKATLSEQTLGQHRVPEISSEYVNFLDKGWLDNVAKK